MRSRPFVLLIGALLASCGGDTTDEEYQYTSTDLEISGVQLLEGGSAELGYTVQVTVANHSSHDFAEDELRLTCEFWGLQDTACTNPTESTGVEPVDEDPTVPASSRRDFLLYSEPGAGTAKIHCTLYWDITQRGYGYYDSANYPADPPC